MYCSPRFFFGTYILRKIFLLYITIVFSFNFVDAYAPHVHSTTDIVSQLYLLIYVHFDSNFDLNNETSQK